MNILFLTCWYPTDERPGNGVFVREHARAAAQSGANVRVLQIWPVYNSSSLWRTEIRDYEDRGVPTTSVLIHSRFYKAIYGCTPLMNLLARRFYLEQVHPRFEVDLVHAHVIYQAGVMAWALHRMHGLPYLVSEHWSKLDWYFDRPRFSYTARTAYREAERVLPVSRYLEKNILGYVPELEKIRMEVIPNVVDTDLFYYEEQEENGGDEIELLAVMNFTHEHKRPLVLFEAISQLPEELQRRITLRLIGKGEDVVDNPEVLRRHYGLKARVDYEGFRNKEAIAVAMRKADFLVHPSERETFGVVVAEALCCGLPCLVSDRWALPERLTGEEGFLVPQNTARSWSEVIREAITDAKRFDRRAIAEANRERYSAVTVGSRITGLYKRVLSSD